MLYTARPNYICPVDRTSERELEALKAHESQFASTWQTFNAKRFLRPMAGR